MWEEWENKKVYGKLVRVINTYAPASLQLTELRNFCSSLAALSFLFLLLAAA